MGHRGSGTCTTYLGPARVNTRRTGRWPAANTLRGLPLTAALGGPAIAHVQLLGERANCVGERLLAQLIEGLVVALLGPRARLDRLHAEPLRKLQHLAAHLLEPGV